MPLHSPVGAALVVASRIGVWSFDLVNSQLTQISVAPREIVSTSSAEMALCRCAECAWLSVGVAECLWLSVGVAACLRLTGGAAQPQQALRGCCARGAAAVMLGPVLHGGSRPRFIPVQFPPSVPMPPTAGVACRRRTPSPPSPNCRSFSELFMLGIAAVYADPASFPILVYASFGAVSSTDGCGRASLLFSTTPAVSPASTAGCAECLDSSLQVVCANLLFRTWARRAQPTVDLAIASADALESA